MEQRSNTRHPVGMSAVVSCPQFGLFRGEVENISSTGMYVRTNLVNVCVNVPVTVTFQPDPDKPSFNIDASGIIVHQDSGGFGLVFEDLSAECLSTLNGVLHALPGPISMTNNRVAV